MRVNKVGLEVEYLVREKTSGEFDLVPPGFDHDVFPVLGEVRTRPCESHKDLAADLLGRLSVTRELLERNANEQGRSYEMVIAPSGRIRLALYKKANRRLRKASENKTANTYNIYYPKVDIEGMSDQVVKNGKIQGCKVSCGLHIHFSSCEVGQDSSRRSFDEDGGSSKRSTVSLLTIPVIKAFIAKLDSELFKPYVKTAKLQGVTKYRHPGYFRLNDHGFEYRSLAATPELLAIDGHLLVLVEKAFECFSLLDDVRAYRPGGDD